jgi:hypothetical protein
VMYFFYNHVRVMSLERELTGNVRVRSISIQCCGYSKILSYCNNVKWHGTLLQSLVSIICEYCNRCG